MLFSDWIHLHSHHHHHSHGHGQQQADKETDTMHIRKPSSSESVSSLSSTSTATSSPTRSHHRRSRVIEFDPLSLNPTFQAPPRLSERAYVYGEQQSPRGTTKELELPPVASPSTTNHDRTEAPEYFDLKLEMLRRPALQRSHWSESTIQTVDVEEREEQDADESQGVATPTPQQYHLQERLVRPATTAWQNFSYKRNTVPRRPPMKAGDSIENYIKRGGWKRRGIVFVPSQQQTENEACDRYSAHTVV